MKFKFPYEKLIEHRKTIEEIARKDFMAARAKVVAAEAELQKMYDDSEAARARSGQLTKDGGLQAAALVQINEFIAGQKYRILHQREEIQKLNMEAEEKHQVLVEAAREHKTLLKLRERRLAEFKLKRKRLELKEVDEIVTTRFKREEV